ncbi:MAG: ATP-binding protein, partial [Campylobacterales bacterium]|nr:ATP-binding protein [Campylobacterales bacterium]
MSMILDELQWLSELIANRMKSYFQNEAYFDSQPPPSDNSHYANFIQKHHLSLMERKVVVLALAFEIAPWQLDIFLSKNELYDKPYSEFGGVTNSGVNGFVPTIQTALFLLCGGDTIEYLRHLKLFNANEKLFAKDILDYHSLNGSLSLIYMPLKLSKNALSLLLEGKDEALEYSPNFPASLLTTKYSWEDLVLPSYTMEHLRELDRWLKHKEVLLDEWNMQKSIQKGYKALFYGASGTGKTLTASLLGQRFNRPVYRIDLSQVVSKYVGETQKNLEYIF